VKIAKLKPQASRFLLTKEDLKYFYYSDANEEVVIRVKKLKRDSWFTGGNLQLRKDFSEALKDRRKELGYSQTQLAEAVGMTQAEVCQRETSNSHAMSIGKLLKICEKLDVGIGFFME
jgi:DNA-binding Xre family transcriptional regulator